MDIDKPFQQQGIKMKLLYTFMLAILFVSINSYAWEAPIFSANEVVCVKDSNDFVSCLMKVEEIEGNPVVEARAKNMVSVGILLPIKESSNDMYIYYSSVSGCKTYDEITKSGKVMKTTAFNRYGKKKTFTSKKRSTEFCKEGLDF